MAKSVVHPWAADTAHIRFGVQTVPIAPWPVLRDFAQAADALGFDALLLPDHPMRTGSSAWTYLSATAEVTRRIRLGTLVSCVAYTNPVVLARAAADLDTISNGRAVLGLGSGDVPWEFGQLGVPWGTRRARQAALAEALQIIHPLLRGETVTFAGEHFRAKGAALNPPPVQQPYVPIMVAGGGETTTLHSAARYGDASNIGAVSWAGGAFTPEDVKRKLAALADHLAEEGRPAEAVLRSGLLAAFLAEEETAALAKFTALPPDTTSIFEQLPVVGTAADAVTRVRDLVACGIDYVTFIVMPHDQETLRLLAERVLPAVAQPLASLPSA